MALYRYVKSPPEKLSHVTNLHKRKVISLGLLTSGLFLLSWTLWPIVSFVVVSINQYQSIVSPLVDSSFSSAGSLSGAVLAAQSENNAGVDFTNANTWFPTSPQKKVVTPINSYALSIPKLEIVNATVVISATDLNQSLIHYGGTALPGQFGTTVIFGHSTLPQFFSPTNYKSIFALLPTLKVGDDFFLTYNQVTYRYKIVAMLVKDATDLTSLEQRFDDSYATLVTCVPPGTYWKRLNVVGQLIKL